MCWRGRVFDAIGKQQVEPAVAVVAGKALRRGDAERSAAPGQFGGRGRVRVDPRVAAESLGVRYRFGRPAGEHLLAPPQEPLGPLPPVHPYLEGHARVPRHELRLVPRRGVAP